MRLFLCGDVMTGRGIDQILPHPGRPELHEAYVRSARGYLALAEAVSGPIARPAAPDYIWGDALEALAARAPEARIVNLETAITTADAAWPGKGIHYRMHPANAACLSAGRIDCCVLANNHVLDWGRDGLGETLDTLHAAGIATAGAGRDADEARAPAQLRLADGSRLLVFAFALASSGVPEDWAATPRRPGVHRLPEEPSNAEVDALAAAMGAARQAGDRVLASIHWGGNWGYAIPAAHQRLARRLIDGGTVDLVHGHSSHHPLGMELYRGRLILYGCGDCINDYEGIPGLEGYRPGLAALYLASIERESGRLCGLELLPMRIRRMRLQRAGTDEACWLARLLNRESRLAGGRLAPTPEGTLRLEPAAAPN